jgi:hypothetical protein
MPRLSRLTAFVLISCVVSIALTTAAKRGAAEDEAGPNAQSSPDAANISDYFEGKVIGIALKGASSESSSSWYSDVKLVEIEGRRFLVGKYYVPDVKEYEAYKSYRGAIHGFAWEEVSRFRAITEDQFKTYVKEWQKRREEGEDVEKL